MASISPQLIKQTALAKTTQLETRVNLLVSSSTTELSPVVVYLEGAVAELSVNGSVSAAGAWTCPAGVSTVQAECWGAGGGGGGGTTTSGGSGGGGGEYAAEPGYAVIPGNIYTYAVGKAGQGGVAAGQGGWAGGTTIFDTNANGVVAHGGGGGDGPTNLNGGTGSANTLHSDGGAGGVSSAGVASDNPTSLANLEFWWAFRGGNTSNGTISSVFDQTGNGISGSAFNSELGPPVMSGIVATNGIAPPQAPGTLGVAAYFKQDPSGRSPSYVTGKSFALGNGSPAPANGSLLTVSCWVQPDTVLGAWGTIPTHSHQYVGLISNCDFISGLNSGYSGTNSSGFALFMQNGQPGFYLNDHTIVSAGRTVLGSALPVTSTWHMITGTWDGTTMTLYVDGASVGTATPGFSKFASGRYAPTVGVNPATLADSAFAGYMSNMYLSYSTASAGFISTAYGTTPETGGSGGGASGGSAATGTAGAAASGSSGAAAGTAASGTGNLGGSGAGGAGGNAAVNGSNAPVSTPYGGGGGGAGASSGTSSVTTLAVPAIHSASYTGFDAQGGNNGVVYDVSDAPQVGVPPSWPGASLLSPNMYAGGNPNAPFNGSFNGLIRMNDVASQVSGFSINSVTASVTIQSTGASVLPIWLGSATPPAMPLTLGSDADIATYLSSVSLIQQVSIPPGVAGRRISFDITSSTLITALANRQVELVFGGLQGSPTYGLDAGAYTGPDAFQWNSVVNGAGSPSASDDFTLSLELYPTGASNKTGGDGAPGSLILSFTDPRYWPVCAIEPAATTDSDGHAFAAGITTDSVMGFDPTVVSPPRVVETWHPLGALGAGSGLTLDLARYMYSPEAGGTVIIQIDFFLTSGTSVTGGQYVFANLLPWAVRPSVSPTSTHDVLAFPVLNWNATSGGLNTTDFGMLVAGRNNPSGGNVTLVVNFTGTASGNSQNTVIARIPLT